MVNLEFWLMYITVQPSRVKIQNISTTQIPSCFFAVNSLTSPPRNHWSNLHDYSLALLEFHLMESYYSVQSLVSGFFHFAKCFRDTSMPLHVKIVVPFCWIGFHCVDINNTMCSSLHQLMDIWVVSSLGLLQVKLLWTFTYKYLCEHVLHFFRAVLKDAMAK